MADDRCVLDGDGWESDERFVGEVEVIAVGIRTVHVHARYQSVLCHLKNGN
jgi:hypothetical protein